MPTISSEQRRSWAAQMKAYAEDLREAGVDPELIPDLLVGYQDTLIRIYVEQNLAQELMGPGPIDDRAVDSLDDLEIEGNP